MLRRRNYFIAFAVVFAISSAYAVIGAQDAKAQSTMGDLIKRIEALESKGGGNVTAPKVKGLKISGHIRTRFESNADWLKKGGGASAPTRQSSGLFTSTLTAPLAGGGDSDESSLGVARSHNYVVQRVRLGFDFDINKNVRSHVMIDGNRTFGGDQNTIQGNTTNTTSGVKYGTNTTASIKQAYFELRNLGDISSILDNVTLLVGRKQWAYGDQRLIGHLNWTNVGRTHDGIIAKWKRGKNWVDAFISQIGTDGTNGAGPGQSITDDDQNVYLYGFWGHFQNPLGVEGILAEPYLFINDGEKSTVDGDNGFERSFGGLRLVGKKMPGLPGIDFSVEPTWQWGEEEKVAQGNGSGGHSIPIQAFGIGVKAGYTFSNIPWSPRVGYELEYASGDDKPGTSKTAQSSSKTFDNLYPLGHAHLGYMDIHGFQNIMAHAVRLSAKPSKKLLLKADLWFFEADEEADALYSVAGGVTRYGADQVTSHEGTVNVDDEYGQELDLVAKYKLFKNVGVVGGYSHYFTGDFMEDTNHGTQPGMDWFWLQAAVKF